MPGINDGINNRLLWSIGALGLTNVQIASAYGACHQDITRMLSPHFLRAETLVRLSSCIGIDTGWLLDGKETVSQRVHWVTSRVILRAAIRGLPTETFGQRLRLAREVLDLPPSSVGQILAPFLGTSRNTVKYNIMRWERSSEITGEAARIVQLSSFYEIDPLWAICGQTRFADAGPAASPP